MRCFILVLQTFLLLLACSTFKQPGIDRIDEDRMTLLHHCCRYGCAEAVKMVLDMGADPNLKDIDGFTPLHFAAGNELDGIASMLIAKGATLESRTNDGHTPLHHAIITHKQPMVEALVEAGVDLFSLTPAKDTCLHLAAAVRNKRAIQFLLDKGLEIDARNKDGRTPLLKAYLYGQHQVKDILVNDGADFQARDKHGNTVLHLAVLKKRTETVADLCRSGGLDYDAVNRAGKTAMHLALESGCRPIIKQLWEIGPRPDIRTDEDRCEILLKAFQLSAERGCFRSRNQLKHSESVIVSTNRISYFKQFFSGHTLPGIDGVTFSFLSPAEIQEVADEAGRGKPAGTGDFMYETAGTIEKKGPGLYSISLSSCWAYCASPKTNGVYCSGGTTVFEFRKILGHWHGWVESMMIS